MLAVISFVIEASGQRAPAFFVKIIALPSSRGATRYSCAMIPAFGDEVGADGALFETDKAGMPSPPERGCDDVAPV